MTGNDNKIYKTYKTDKDYNNYKNDKSGNADNIYIIPLKKAHINKVCAIEKECFTDPWKKEIFLELLGYPYAVNIAAAEIKTGIGAEKTKKTEEIAGYCIFYHIWDECQIMNIAVKKSMQNKKIATKLLSAVLEYAETENIAKIILEVRRSNAKAIALYKKFGFEIDGVRENYYKRPKEDALLMSLQV